MKQKVTKKGQTELEALRDENKELRKALISMVRDQKHIASLLELLLEKD